MAEYDENGDRLPEFLSLSKAEQAVHKSRHTIWRWRRDGMPTVVGVDGQRYVLLSDLQTFYRRGIQNQKRFQYGRRTGLTPTPEDPVDATNSLTLPEAAARTGLKLVTMHAWRTAGMPVYLVHNEHRVKASDVDWWHAEMRRRKRAGQCKRTAQPRPPREPDWGRLTARFSDYRARVVTQGEKRLLTLMVTPRKSLVVFPTPAGWVAQWALIDDGRMTPATKGELLEVPTTRLPIGAITAAVRQETRKQKSATR